MESNILNSVKEKIRLSVVICTYNRGYYLRDAFRGFKAQILIESSCEVMFVNNNSTDNTEINCWQILTENLGRNIIYTLEKKKGLSSARNHGIQKTFGEYLSYIDDDAIVRNDYLANIISAFDRNIDIMALGGKIIPVYSTSNPPVWLSKFLNGLVSKVDLGNYEFIYKKKYPYGCNMAFRKQALIHVGMFNAELTWRSDDKYIFGELRKHKMLYGYYPSVFVNHIIDDKRLELPFIIKLSRTIGTTERIRVTTISNFQVVLKFMEILGKLAFSMCVAFFFFIIFKPIKAKYLLIVMFNILYGYLKNINVGY